MMGYRLKIVRESVGQDQKTFALSIGVSSPNTIYRWERGLAFPPGDALALIHEKYGINIHWLVTGQGSTYGETELQRLSRVAQPTPIEEAMVEQIRQWMSDLTTEDPDYRAWFKIQFQSCFPEFLEWQKKRTTGPSEDSTQVTGNVA